MRSIADIVEQCRLSGRSFSEQALFMESEETGSSPDILRKGMLSRLKDMEFSVREAVSKEWRGLIVPAEASLLEQYAALGCALSGPYVLSAARIAMAVSTYNAAMGRIVAAPTAGSCGILPGMLFACREQFGTEDDLLLSGLFAAAAVGEVTAARATLAGASGGCQAECGSAAAMGAAALVTIRGGSADAVSSAVALTFKSILGLVCDPVGGYAGEPRDPRGGHGPRRGEVPHPRRRSDRRHWADRPRPSEDPQGNGAGRPCRHTHGESPGGRHWHVKKAQGKTSLRLLSDSYSSTSPLMAVIPSPGPDEGATFAPV